MAKYRMKIVAEEPGKDSKTTTITTNGKTLLILRIPPGRQPHEANRQAVKEMAEAIGAYPLIATEDVHIEVVEVEEVPDGA
jgi:hypothetical protein